MILVNLCILEADISGLPLQDKTSYTIVLRNLFLPEIKGTKFKDMCNQRRLKAICYSDTEV